MRGPKAKQTEELKKGEESEEDSEMEAFANDLIEKEMRKMNGEAEVASDGEDDEVLSQLEGEELSQEEDFFGDEEGLEEVNVGEDEEEVEMGEEEEEEMESGGEEYG